MVNGRQDNCTATFGSPANGRAAFTTTIERANSAHETRQDARIKWRLSATAFGASILPFELCVCLSNREPRDEMYAYGMSSGLYAILCIPALGTGGVFAYVTGLDSMGGMELL